MSPQLSREKHYSFLPQSKNVVVSKDTSIKLVDSVIRLFRFIDTKGLFTLRWGTQSHHPTYH